MDGSGPNRKSAATSPQLHRKREQQWIAEMDAMPARDGLCYFVGTDAMVKIGHSKDVGRRMREIRVAADLPEVTLFATATGSYYRERHYHHRFAEHRLFGEWFARCPEIEAEIARLTRQEDEE